MAVAAARRLAGGTTFFEVITAAGLEAFRRAGSGRYLEAGLGGRFDATSAARRTWW